MKNIWKRLFAAMLCVFLLIPLAGCDALDEMRANQAFMQEDGTILWNSKIYKPLPNNDYFQPSMDSDINVTLTADDVPVLLSDMMAITYMVVSQDKVLLHNYSGYYCREDFFDVMSQKMIEPLVPEELCYQYGYYDYEQERYITDFYTLSAEQTRTIDFVLQSVTPKIFEQHPDYYSEPIYVEQSSKDHIMRRDFVTILVENLGVYLVLDSGAEYEVYSVPDAFQSVFYDMAEVRSQLLYKNQPVFPI